MLQELARNEFGAIFTTTENVSGLFNFYFIRRRRYNDGTYDYNLCAESRADPSGKYLVLQTIRGNETDAENALKALISQANPVKTATVKVPLNTLNVIRDYVEGTAKEYQGEDNTISYTASFGNGFEMDIKCCGCDDNSSWLEAVLFKNGSEIVHTDPEYGEFTGPWELEFGGNIYRALVEVEPPKCQVPKEDVLLKIIRKGLEMKVAFKDLRDGDAIVDSHFPRFVVCGDAHISGDSSYDGYIVYDVNSNGYFPEDFC